MTREEKKNELIGLFSTGAIFIGDLIDECFAFGQQHPHWISVEDELPKEDGIYLFYDAETQGVYINYFWADLKLNEKITHWMPMLEEPEHRANASKKKTVCPDCIVAQYPSCDKMIPCCQCHDEGCNSRQSCPKKGGEQ